VLPPPPTPPPPVASAAESQGGGGHQLHLFWLFFAKGPLRSPAALLLHVMQIGDEMIFSLTHL
jgi:hypothetical protein